MRERVAVQALTETDQGGGSYADGYATTSTIWAAVDEVTGAEALRADMPATSRLYRVTYRTGTTVPAKGRLLHGSTPLYVKSTAAVGTKRSHIEALCEARDDGV